MTNGNTSWDSGWRIGTISYMDQGKIKVRSSAEDTYDRMDNGSMLHINGLTQYLFSYLGLYRKVVFRVVSIEDIEKPYGKEESYRLLEQYLFTAVPIGELRNGKFVPGVIDLPMVGSSVYACGNGELDALFCGDEGISIGSLVGYHGTRPTIGLDSLFSNHLAILGNTGSGKSTTARLLLSKVAEEFGRGASEDETDDGLEIKDEALFVVFDLHGDYKCITDAHTAEHVKRVAPNQFHLPVGSLDMSDWSAILDPSKRIQKPLLERAVKYSRLNEWGKKLLYAAFAYNAIRDTSVDSHAARKFQIAKYYEHIADDLTPVLSNVISALKEVKITPDSRIEDAKSSHDLISLFNLEYGNLPKGLTTALDSLLIAYLCTGDAWDTSTNTPSIDSITTKYIKEENEVSIDDVIGALDFAFDEEEVRGNRQTRSYSEGLVTQLNNLRDRYASGLFDRERGESITDAVLNSKGLLVIDVSEVLDEDGLALLSTFVANSLFSRNCNDASKKSSDKLRPVYLVFDEAHRYIRESVLEDDSVFNRIAREGRKFGVRLAVISQIPSELSKVVLSQTGAFLIHRIQNAVDLDYIRRNVPSITADQVSRLPSFAPGTSVVLGSSIPATFELEVDGTYKDVTPPISMFRT